jgi:DNA-binding helix-hairpin-helix protein with protein kinase domain
MSLSAGQTLKVLSTGSVCTVENLLGEGGQGWVYQVSFMGRPFALKWYNDRVLQYDKRLRARLQTAIDHGPPSPRFLWPFSLVTLRDGSRLGYLMPLRDPRLKEVSTILGAQKTPDGVEERVAPSFRVLATICCLVAQELLALHAKGLAYQDLNSGNLFFDPNRGQIAVCDNDNVDIDGAPSVMGGVWEYQAPEIVLRQTGPTRVTDLHSLAVMLFRILHIGHPLVGQRAQAFGNLSDTATVKSLFGTDPLFIFDPRDESNRPDPGEFTVAYWGLYPGFLKELFTRAFTDGLRDPRYGRVQETEWRLAMARLRDSILTCSCTAENFYDRPRVAGAAKFSCWYCGADLPVSPPRIGIHGTQEGPQRAPRHVVVLDRGASLFGYHSEGGQFNLDAVTARVDEEAGELGLTNSSRAEWTCRHRTDTVLVPPGARLRLRDGMQIDFGATRGEVRM